LADDDDDDDDDGADAGAADTDDGESDYDSENENDCDYNIVDLVVDEDGCCGCDGVAGIDSGMMDYKNDDDKVRVG